MNRIAHHSALVLPVLLILFQSSIPATAAEPPERPQAAEVMSAVQAVNEATIAVTMPGPGYLVEYWAYSRYCPDGLCAHHTVPTDATNVARVPKLLPMGGDTYTWYDRVYVKFRPDNGSAHIHNEQNLAPPLDLHPLSQPADRLTTVTPVCNSYWVDIMELFREYREFTLAWYGFARGSASVELLTGNGGGPQYSSTNDRVGMPRDPAYFETSSHTLRYAVFHEASHWMPRVSGIEGPDGGPALHEGCTLGATAEQSYCEGSAHMMAVEAVRWYSGFPMDSPLQTCWQRAGADKSEFLHMVFEDNVAAYLHEISKRDPVGFWNTTANTRVALPGGAVMPIQTAEEFHASWQNDDSMLRDRQIGVFAPGSFDADSLWGYYIEGIEPSTVVTGTDVSGAGNLFGEKNIWLRSVYPNPSHGSFSLQVRAPSSGSYRMELYSVHGRLMYTQTFTGLAIGEHRLSITPPRLASGRYFIFLKDPENEWVVASSSIVVVQ